MIKDILENLGYKLVDNGNHWRTSALYRNGNNATALQIYKNTGVWNDYVEDSKSKPFEALVKLTLEGQPKKLKETLKLIDRKQDSSFDHKTKSLIEMEKTYDKSILDKLFPNYNFYKKRNISDETQKAFQVGLAGNGNMYRRMVFPIYNDSSQIIGFSGRRVDDNNFAKWKHIGKKNNWVYPAYLPNKETVDKTITKERKVFLVESIGDAMALYEHGIKNVLVIFGLSVSTSIISYLSGKSLDKIIIAGNNDFNSEENRGLIASIKNYIKLSSYFDLDTLAIKVPPKGSNDLGEAHEGGEDLSEWSTHSYKTKEQRKFISDFVIKNEKKFSKSHIKKASKINE